MCIVKILLIILCSPIILLALFALADMFGIIDKIFKEDKNTEDKMKKKDLIAEVTELKDTVNLLKDRIEVLEFKEKSEGARIIKEDGLFKFLSNDGKKVIKESLSWDWGYTYKINGEYVEKYLLPSWSFGSIDSQVRAVFEIDNNKLVPVDLELYKKAKKFDSMKAELKDKINV